MKPNTRITVLVLGLSLMPNLASAFNSGSTGADGAFNPTVNTVLQLPPNGIFNFTSVNIPTGITVKFAKNAGNTPVILLATGDVTLAGTIDISGSSSPDVGTAGDGNVGDDGQTGVGGPGGYDGGRGGFTGTNRRGGDGLGPGGGVAGAAAGGNCAGSLLSGGGGGFGTVGVNGFCGNSVPALGGPSYGSPQLLPLIGGSGGGGGFGGTSFAGSGGGGSGGAILIAASGTATVSGSLLANGGMSGASSGTGAGSRGGAGSGGAIRVIATTITGNGTLSAAGAPFLVNSSGEPSEGGAGRIRLEAEDITRTVGTTPTYSFGTPGPVFLVGSPKLIITSVAGVNAPTNPTGNADIALPSTITNPVTVTFATTGVPAGNTVKLTITPANSAAITATSSALAGDTTSASASVSVSLPSGPSVLSASVTYTITASLGNALSRFAQGERVEKITVGATLGKSGNKITLITVSGKEYEAPAEVFVVAGTGG